MFLLIVIPRNHRNNRVGVRILQMHICGIVNNIGREGEQMQVMTLSELRDTKVDMFTTVFIGNTQTKIINGKMVTPRGYKDV